MPTIPEVLVKKGQASQASGVIPAEVFLTEQSLRPDLQESRRIYNIDGCNTVNDFKQTAKAILLQDRGKINWLIQKAESKSGVFTSGSDNLLRILDSIRKHSNGLDRSSYEQLLRRSFRRAGAKPYLPMAS